MTASSHRFSLLKDTQGTTARGLFYFDAGGESVLKLVDVGDDQDLGEIRADQIDRFDQALATLGVLAAKALIDYQHLQASAGALGKHF